MPTKPKRKARGIVVTVERPTWLKSSERRFLHVRWDKVRGTLLDAKDLYRAGCPRLKPWEVKKVRVTIEEVK